MSGNAYCCSGSGNASGSGAAETPFLLLRSPCAIERTCHVRVGGLSLAGKTSFLKYLIFDGSPSVPTPDPTKQMEVCRARWDTSSLIFWDSRKLDDAKEIAKAITPDVRVLGPETKLIADAFTMDALIYVIDSSDRGRLPLASRDFAKFIRAYHNVSTVLILGTKIDLPLSNQYSSHLTRHEISTGLRVNEIAYDRKCAICLVSSVTGEGVDMAMQWLISAISKDEGVCTQICRAIMKTNKSLFWNPFGWCSQNNQ